ncbi:asparaginase [Coprothermobacter platensis]|uniref:asparaginase n=1 Tax=Coprothermobacter platensis TaxID=108819 RepID=UPI000373CE73|nr:asparaginase [Coprothermobacter platensis]
MDEYANQPTLGAVVTRNELVESVHYADAVVVDCSGRLIASAGSPQRVTFLRSASKPLQVLPLLMDHLDEKYGFTTEELAVMCASHAGTLEHVSLVRSALGKIGLDETYLQCGMHEPFDKQTADYIKINNIPLTPAFHNCSGKHTAMLAQCVYNNWPVETYYLPDHPVQQRILKVVSSFFEMPKERVNIGIDGCGVPVFGVPLFNAALAFAKLGKPEVLPQEYQEPAKKVINAMTTYPHLIAGHGRFDTEFMLAFHGSFLTKGGAEAVQLISVVGKGIGVGIKVVDGSSRALGAISLEVLRQLGLISSEELNEEPLKHLYCPPVENHRKELVGNIKPVIQLKIDPGWNLH